MKLINWILYVGRKGKHDILDGKHIKRRKGIKNNPSDTQVQETMIHMKQQVIALKRNL